jgi:hypothetical protein
MDLMVGFNGSGKNTKVRMRYIDAKFGKIDNFKIIDVRMLNDSGNKQEDYELNILRVTSELFEGNKVVICYETGQSKSNAIALGVLVKYFKMSFHEAWDLIKKQVPNSSIDPVHIESLKRILM